ncbi:peptide deformylase [Patescibacteria group bacterium]|nr:peptide deformylase [Patescibacteria group bacterium]
MEILQKENPILREKAQEIDLEDISSAKIKKLIADMKKILEKQENGAALAAPQVGEPLRLFIISEKISGDEKTIHTIYINPEITKLSKKTEWMEEGCLSVKGIYGKVKRSTNCNIVAYDENGKKFTRGAGGLLAQIFQHETDHLNGILFIDKAKDLQQEEK